MNKALQIAILGYGKMGKEIEKVLIQRGHQILIRASHERPVSINDLRKCDVAIEFSRPDAAVENIYKCFETHCPIVVGTTGWYDRLNEVTEQCVAKDAALMYATNFSIGVNIIFRLNKLLARMMNAVSGYDAAILEVHHIHKLDKPSGTAITLAEGLLENYKRKNKWVNEETNKADELAIISKREGEVPGTHVVTYSSVADDISIVHSAHNRSGFALGAVLAAEWLHGKKGVFTMNDLLKIDS